MEEMNFNRINDNLINYNIDGLYYNNTEDSMYIFTQSKPRSYTKISRFSNSDTVYEEKPIEAWFMLIFDYEKVFEFDNKVFFMKNNKFDYFDFELRILVRDINFKHYFLRDECQLLPLTKH